jgi:poly-gamma-glutamate system protein
MNKSRRRSPFTPIYAAGAVSLAYVLLALFGPGRQTPFRSEEIEAARLMARAESAVRDCRAGNGFPVDQKSDPNRTGLIGLDISPITTSLGNLGAKRTTTNPNFAGLIVRLFNEAGVRKGNTVAVGASSSFPALIIAALSAANVMGVKPLVISSLGASEWGANIPAFNWLDMEECLQKAGLLDVRPIALAIGGDEDMGRDMDQGGRELLQARIRESGIPFLEKPDLRANVEERLRLYEEAAGGRPIEAFINIGGSWANIGTNAEVLKLKPGLLRDVFVPPPGERGVLQAMAGKKIPVIHLLNIKGLAERYGLPWDPRPLPGPGEGGFYSRAQARGIFFILESIIYIALVVVVVLGISKSRAFPGPL